MAQDIRAATFWYDIRINDQGQAERYLKKTRQEFYRNKDATSALDRQLSLFFSRSKIGFLGFGAAAGAALGQVVKGSTALSDLLSIPGEFFKALGRGVDVAAPGFLAQVERLLAEAKTKPIQFGAAVRKEGLQKALEEAIGSVTAGTIKVGIEFITGTTKQDVEKALKSGISDALGGNLTGVPMGPPNPFGNASGAGARSALDAASDMTGNPMWRNLAADTLLWPARLVDFLTGGRTAGGNDHTSGPGTRDSGGTIVNVTVTAPWGSYNQRSGITGPGVQVLP